MVNRSFKKFRSMDEDVPVTKTYVETLLRAKACVQPSNMTVQQMADNAEALRCDRWLVANIADPS